MNRRKFLSSGIGVGLAGLVKPVAQAKEHDLGPIIRLNANENALGLAPSARKVASQVLSESNRYPFLEMFELVEQIADRESVSPKSVLLGNGSSELLRLVVQALATPDLLVVMAQPTYEAVGGIAHSLGIEVERLPLTSNYSHDLERVRQKARDHVGRTLVYICNPNNPTATLTPSSELQKWIKTSSPDTLFLIDEAYHHYVEDSRYFSFLETAAESDNVIATRTFSKVYAMAGLRLGFMVGTPKTIREISALTRLNVNNVAISAARASLDDNEFLIKSLASNRKSKNLLLNTLKELELDALDSHTNFVMFELKSTTEDFAQRMRSRNILVGRPFPPFTNFNRISLGTPGEMLQFCQTLKDFREQGWA